MEPTITNRTAAAAAGDIPTTETIARQLLDAVTALEGLVPDFTAHNPREIKRVAASAKFAHELIVPTITTVTSAPSAQKKNLFDVARGQDALLYRDTIRPIAQRLAAFATNLEFTVDSKLFAAGEQALETYQWAKRAANSAGGEALRPFVDEMQRVVKKAINRRSKKAAPAPAPTPAPGHAFMALAAPAETGDDRDDDLPDSYYRALDSAE